ncbi:MAG TPA: sigma-70 family RNA polymerase sigma factor [Herpetosiphonaceae bacterium]
MAAESSEEITFDAIYAAYFRPVYNYAYYRLRDIAAADDLTAQIFERVLRNFHRYRPERAPFPVWLWTIARRAVQTYAARQRLIRWLPLAGAAERPSGHSPEEIVLARLDQQALVAAFATLSAREQDLVALKFVGGLTNRQIAAVAGLSESNVGTIVARTLRKLRGLLADPHHEQEDAYVKSIISR